MVLGIVILISLLLFVVFACVLNLTSVVQAFTFDYDFSCFNVKNYNDMPEKIVHACDEFLYQNYRFCQN